MNNPKDDLNNEAPVKNRPSAYIKWFILGLGASVLMCVFPARYLANQAMLDSLIPGKPAPGWYTNPTPEINVWLPTPQSQEDIDRFVDLGITLSQSTERCKDAIVVWNAVIDFTDTNYQAYAGRAKCVYRLAPMTGAMTNYISSMENALADIDRAIELYPASADFYAFRRDVLIGLSNRYTYQVDYAYMYDLAAQNDRAFLALAYNPERRRSFTILLASDLIEAGQCEEGMKILEEIKPVAGDPNCALCARAAGYACLGEMDNAIKSADELLSINPDSRLNAANKALYLYLADKKDEAFALLNQSIAKNPDFGGTRYYVRALLDIEFGDYNQANQDLQMGTGGTWDRRGLYQYAYAKIALNNGDKQEGEKWLRSAEASLPVHMTALRRRIQQEMTTLGLKPLEVPANIVIPMTPMPTFIP